jgi:uncharacterized HAD superfamily protein
MKRKAIGIDIDAVLANSDPLFIRELSNIVKRPLKRRDNSSFKYEEAFGISDKEMDIFWKEFTKKKLWLKIPPLENAVETVRELNETYHIAIVSARPESVKEQTMEWLKINRIDYDEIHFTNFGDKAKKLEHLKKLDYFLEDNPSFVENLISRNVKIILFNYPWNRDYKNKNIIRVNSWLDVQKILFKSNLNK